jgi:hypothetical protein
MRHCVWLRNLENEEAKARYGTVENTTKVVVKRRKQTKNVSNGWVNQHGLLVVRYWQEKPLVLGKILMPVSDFHLRSHVDLAEIKPAPIRCEAGDWPRESWQGQFLVYCVFPNTICIIRIDWSWSQKKYILGNILKKIMSGNWILKLLSY